MTSSLLLACIRRALGVCDAADVAQAATGFQNWRELLTNAGRNGLLPLVAACLDDCAIPVPGQIRTMLARALRENARRVLVMSEELNRIMRRLDAGGIPTLAFKGPVSAHTLYNDPAWRVFCDLDLLVPREYIPDARRLLSECGYEPSGSPRTQIAREASIYRFTELSLENAANGIQLDLHWELTPPDWFVSMPDGFWERTRHVPIGRHSVRTLGEADAFLYLCLHGGKHGWCSLSWLVDLCSLVIRTPGVAAESLALFEPRSNAAPMVLFALAAAAVLVPHLPNKTDLAEQVVTSALAGTMPDETHLTRFKFQWSLGGNRLAICRFALRRVFTPNQDDWSSWPIERKELLFLLVPWRLLRLTWTFGCYHVLSEPRDGH